jgi:hypothetical protein
MSDGQKNAHKTLTQTTEQLNSSNWMFFFFEEF